MKPLRILLLAADSGEGGLGDLLDPVLRKRFDVEEIEARSCYISDLRREHLDGFHAVALLRSPIPGHPLSDLADFAQKAGWLREFTEQGGGLLLMFTECYGKTEAPLNELSAPWGLRFFFNVLLPGPGVTVERFPRFTEGEILPFHWCDGAPFAIGSPDLGLVTLGGHGTQQLTCVFEGPGAGRWRPLLRGGPGITSRGYRGTYINTSNGDIPDPVVAAAAEIGAGRVVAFPGSAPFWVVNPCIWRFDGQLLDQRSGAGFRFLVEALRWLAGTVRNRALGAEAIARALPVDEGCLVKPDRFSFRLLDAAERQKWTEAEPQRIWLGDAPKDAEKLNLLAGKLAAVGCRVAFPCWDFRELDEAAWSKAKDACAGARRPGLEVVAAHGTADGEGVRWTAITTGALPRHADRYPNSTLLEAVWVTMGGSASILRTPLSNRIPPERYGGYNLVEWQDDPSWAAMYGRLMASKYPLSPVAFDVGASMGGAQTWVLGPAGAAAFDLVRGNRHMTFVTEGPHLRRFALAGGTWIDDEWEGHWWGYRPGKRLRLRACVESTSALEEVVLHDGEEVFARWTPRTTRFEGEWEIPIWRDHVFHLTARDAMGKRLLATFPLATRNLDFWGHVGSDQMNNYVNALEPSEGGYLGVGDHLCDPFGFVTLGAAWGDYLRMTPALSYSQFMPRQEISGVIGSFHVHHPSAIVREGERLWYLNDHRRLFSCCCADAQRFLSTVVGQHAENDGKTSERWHGREVVPTRAFTRVPGARGEDEIVVWRWRPGEPVCVEVTKQMDLDARFLHEEWLTFASNTHHALPGLRVGGVGDGHGTAVASLPVRPSLGGAHKEWDNSHYLRRFGEMEPVFLEIPAVAGGLWVGNDLVGSLAWLRLGKARDWRALLFSDGKEFNIFVQGRLVPAERASGRVTFRYLLALGAREEPTSAFALQMRDDLAEGEDGPGFSHSLDLSGAVFPHDLDLDRRFPASRGRTLRVRVRGLPPGTVHWTDARGGERFSSQAVRGESYHQLPPDPVPRVFSLTWNDHSPSRPA